MGARRKPRRAEDAPRRTVVAPDAGSRAEPSRSDREGATGLLRAAGNRALGHVLRTSDPDGPSTHGLPGHVVQRRGPDDEAVTGGSGGPTPEQATPAPDDASAPADQAATPAPAEPAREKPKPTKQQAGWAEDVLPSERQREQVASDPGWETRKDAAEKDVVALVGKLDEDSGTLNALLLANDKGTLTTEMVKERTGKTLDEAQFAALKKALDARWEAAAKLVTLRPAQVRVAMERDILHAVGDAGAADTVAAGRAAAREWFAQVERMTFLGVRTGPLHSDMRSCLETAASSLKKRLAVTDDAEAGMKLGLQKMNGLRQPKPATGGRSPSLHCYGLATDINVEANPFVRSKRSGQATKRAMLLVHQRKDKGVLQAPLDDPGAQWERLHEQSEALKTYLSLRLEANADELERAATALREAGLHTRGTAWWKKKIAQDHKKLHKSTSFTKDPDQGFMDLQKMVVEELTAAGLDWGGQYATGKDIMHFDYRKGKLKRLKSSD